MYGVRRRAISPAIATLLLMGVAVAGGMAVWQLMSMQVQVIATAAKLDVVEASLVRLQPDGKAFFSVTLKNSGTVPLEGLRVGFWDDSGTYAGMAHDPELQPGLQWGDGAVVDAAVTPNRGYAVSISATAPDGSQFSAARTVTAAG